MKNTLFIVDDHSMIRHGLKDWLEANSEWKVTDVFENSKTCFAALESLKIYNHPEIIIVDVQLIGETGFTLCHEIKERYPHIKTVMYSMYDTPGYILQAKDNGAMGYISKVASDQELLNCLAKVQNGEMYLEEKMVEAQTKLDSIVNIFSKQERLVFEMILQKKSNEEIEDELFISKRTVENYISHLYEKLDVKNKHEILEKFGGIK